MTKKIKGHTLDPVISMFYIILMIIISIFWFVDTGKNNFFEIMVFLFLVLLFIFALSFYLSLEKLSKTAKV